MPPILRHLWVVLPLLAGCGVDFVYPDDARVLCTSDAQCNGDNVKCSLAAGVCIPADDPDVSPEITSVTATDASHIVVVFSTPLRRDELGRISSYAVNHRVSVVGIAVSDENTRVTLTTTTMRSRDYVLSTTALADNLGRPLASLQAAFVGVGEPLDSAGPTTLAPSDRARVPSRDVTFTWTADVDAASFVLEVARDAAFTDIVVRGEDILEPTVTLPLPADDTYYWRVQADISVFSEPAVFAVVGDGLRVHCPEGASCVEDLSTFRGGDPKHPLVDPGYALALARTIGVTRVTIARRSDATSASYTAKLFVTGDGLTITGGYDAAFLARDPARPTMVTTSETALRVTASDVVIEGFGFVGGSSTAAVVVVVGGMRDALRGLTIFANAHDAAPLHIQSASELQLSDVSVDGVLDSNRGTDSEIASSKVRTERTRFVTRALTVSGAADVDVVDSVIASTAITLPDADVNGAHHALLMRSPARVALLRSVVSIDVTHELYDSIVVINNGGQLRAEASTLFGTRLDGYYCNFDGCTTAVVLSTDGVVQVVDSLVQAADDYTAAFDIRSVSSPARFDSIGSTIVANGYPLVVNTPSIESVVMNSVLMATGVPCILDNNGAPSAITHSALIGCPTISTSFPSLTDLDAAGSSFAGNFVPSETTVDLFPGRAGMDAIAGTVDDVFAPSATSSLAGTGVTSFLTYTASTTDILGLPRSSPPSVGAWEAR